MARARTGRTGARFGAPGRSDDLLPGGAAPDPAGPPVAPPADEPARPVGARFGGRSGGRSGGRAGLTAEPTAPEPTGPAPTVAQPGPRPPAGPGAVRAPGPAPVPALAPGPAEVTGPLGVASPARPQRPEPPGPTTRAVRPYVLTGGRTRPSRELRLETLLRSVAGPAVEAGERGAVLSLCGRPRSVGEVAALTRMPLGVAQVLVGDLVTEGRLLVHGDVAGEVPDLELMGRVLAGLRRL